MTINDYIQKLNSRYKTGISTEHSYRGYPSSAESLSKSMCDRGSDSYRIRRTQHDNKAMKKYNGFKYNINYAS